MTDIMSLKSAFVSAAYYEVHPILVRYTAEFRKDLLFAQIVVLETATEEELDDTMDILGGIVGEFSTLVADFELIKLENFQGVENIAPLKIGLFQRAL